MIAPRPLSKVEHGLYLSAAVSFLFFLVFSAPHRVHHYFEQFPAPWDHYSAQAQPHEHADGEQRRHNDQHDRKSYPQNDCAVLSIAKTVHASAVYSFDFTVFQVALTRDHDQSFLTGPFYNLSPFSQRAPPSV
jgi:hypothetical protein